MSRTWLWVLVAGCLILSAWAGRRYINARSEAAISLRQLTIVRNDAREIAAIRAAAPPESRRHRPPPGLASRVADVVSRAGLPQSALQNLSPETEAAADTSGLRKQSMKITLDGLTLPQLGRFLEVWRATQPLWMVASIDITPTSSKTRSAPGQAVDRQLRAVLGIETLFAEGSR
jgi:hypothetical protein